MAARAGVGVGTVSRVLNDSPGVAEGTRERVRAVMDELGYRPSATARNLSLGRTQTLGVIAPFFTSPSVVERLRGIDDVVGRSPYDLKLFNIETRDQRRAALRRFARRDRVDGVIVISLPLTPGRSAGSTTTACPRSASMSPTRSCRTSRSMTSPAARWPPATCSTAGHRDRIAFVGDVEENAFGFASSERRLDGFRDELHRCGLGLPASYIKRGPFGRATASWLAPSCCR